jgi:DNA polymerase sigma
MYSRFFAKELMPLPRGLSLNVKVGGKPPLICELSMTNTHMAFETSKLFWIYSKIDERVAPLVLFVCHWAELVGLTKNSTTLFTNLNKYHLKLLVFNYLMQLEAPILPPLERMLRRFKPLCKELTNNSQETLLDFTLVDFNLTELKYMNMKNNIGFLKK